MHIEDEVYRVTEANLVLRLCCVVQNYTINDGVWVCVFFRQAELADHQPERFNINRDGNKSGNMLFD